MSLTRQVALLVTCVVDQAIPEIGLAAARLLERAGCTVIFPEAQTCCGQPFSNSGFLPEAVRLARRTIEIFEPYPCIVLPSGSCTTMLRVEYPHLLAGDPAWAARARALAAKTFELSEFLTQQPPPAAPPTPAPSTPLTYHDSCHMCRTLHLRAEPRRLLATAGLPVAEMAESDRCCGFGGLFSARMPEISEAMAREKLAQAAAAGAATLVTADPGCLLHLRRLAEGTGMQVEHLATVVEEATR